MTDPLLVIDAGNTRIKWGLCDGGRWLSAGFVDTEDCAGLSSRLGHVPQHIIISNVAGGEVEAGLLAQLSGAGKRIHVISSLGAQCGVRNSYRNPAQLGTDRWAALIGARRLGAGAKPAGSDQCRPAIGPQLCRIAVAVSHAALCAQRTDDVYPFPRS